MLVREDGSNVVSFVSSRQVCFVWTVRLSGSEEAVLLRVLAGNECCWSGRRATTIFLITLEVANSKAKSEGIQIYCYKKLWAMWE